MAMEIQAKCRNHRELKGSSSNRNSSKVWLSNNHNQQMALC